MVDKGNLSTEELTKLFKSMSNPIRVSIIRLLQTGSMSYTTLLARLNNPATGTLNFHLSKMQDLIVKDKDVYKLTPVGEQMAEMMNSYSEVKVQNVINETPKKDLWQDYLNIDYKYLFPLGILLLLIPFLAFFTNQVLIIDAALVLTFYVFTRFVLQKIYLEDNHGSVALLSVFSMFAVWLFFNSVTVGFYIYFYLTVLQLFQSQNPYSILTSTFPLYQGNNIQLSLNDLFYLAVKSRIFEFNLAIILGISIGIFYSYYLFGEAPPLSNLRIKEGDENISVMRSKSRRSDVVGTLIISLSILMINVLTFIFIFSQIIRVDNKFSEQVLVVSSVLLPLILFSIEVLLIKLIVERVDSVRTVMQGVASSKWLTLVIVLDQIFIYSVFFLFSDYSRPDSLNQGVVLSFNNNSLYWMTAVFECLTLVKSIGLYSLFSVPAPVKRAKLFTLMFLGVLGSYNLMFYPDFLIFTFIPLFLMIYVFLIQPFEKHDTIKRVAIVILMLVVVLLGIDLFPILPFYSMFVILGGIIFLIFSF